MLVFSIMINTEKICLFIINWTENYTMISKNKIMYILCYHNNSYRLLSEK